jgi:hypothetical protein
MSRKPSPISVTSKVSLMKVDQEIKFDNPYTSVAVMVSNLKSKPDHCDKIFKIKCIKNKTIVTRIK